MSDYHANRSGRMTLAQCSRFRLIPTGAKQVDYLMVRHTPRITKDPPAADVTLTVFGGFGGIVRDTAAALRCANS